IQLSALSFCGVYRFLWRYIGMAELAPFLRAAGISFIGLLALRFGLPSLLGAAGPPISVALSTSVLGIGGVLAARVAVRAAYERWERDRKRRVPSRGGGRRALRTLLVGAGQAGLLAARELAREARPGLEVLGFVDDDPGKREAVLHGIPVLGTLSDLP